MQLLLLIELFLKILIFKFEGEFVAILGEKGCGKLTLLNLIVRFENSSDGEILLNGNLIKDINLERMMIFLEPALFPWLTIFQNIENELKLVKIPKVQREQIVMHYLEVVGLSIILTSTFINFPVV